MGYIIAFRWNHFFHVRKTNSFCRVSIDHREFEIMKIVCFRSTPGKQLHFLSLEQTEFMQIYANATDLSLFAISHSELFSALTFDW